MARPCNSPEVTACLSPAALGLYAASASPNRSRRAYLSFGLPAPSRSSIGYYFRRLTVGQPSTHPNLRRLPLLTDVSVSDNEPAGRRRPCGRVGPRRLRIQGGSTAARLEKGIQLVVKRNGFEELPEDLPVPEDDGAAGHLPGMRLPSVPLASTANNVVDLSTLEGRTVVYCYPMTGRTGENLPLGCNEIPGATGCTPQSGAFRDHYAELRALGARVFGISTQDTDYQTEAAERLHLPFELLSDENLRLAAALVLPTFEVEGMVLLKRLAFVANGGLIEKVFYPVFPPSKSAEEVVEWLSHNPLGATLHT